MLIALDLPLGRFEAGRRGIARAKTGVALGAAVRIAVQNRASLERFLRYCPRPPFFAP